jgi:adenylate cyclase
VERVVLGDALAREQLIAAFEPLGPAAVLADRQEELRLWNQTLRAYRAGQWDQAEVNLINLRRADPANSFYRAYARIVGERRRNPPPPGWDGVTAFAEK